MSAAVRAREVGRRFGDRAVLAGIDLAVEPGEILVIVGQSGCGKSTLLRAIGGLDDGYDGAIDVDGRVGFGFQDARLLPWARVWENVVFGLAGSRAERRTRAAADPAVLLLDEPFGALDALTRLRMQALVVGLWQRRRFAIVLVTHDVEEAILLADRIAVLDGGTVADVLDVDLRRPRSRRDDRFESLRVRILEDLGVSDVDARLSAHPD
jgi:sulfonate transport system ATP-binding protein